MPPLRIAVLPSPALGALLCVVHLGAGALGAILPVPVWSKVILLAAVAWSLVRCLEKNALVQTPGAIVGVDVTHEGGVTVRTRDGAWLECELLPSSFVSHRLTILNLRPLGGRRERHVVLCCGNVNETDLRRLRVRLRWAAPGSLNREA
jgi:hypothetical protein